MLAWLAETRAPQERGADPDPNSMKQNNLGHYMWVCPDEKPVLTGTQVSATRHLLLCARIGP
jgi:hypothetical protein